MSKPLVLTIHPKLEDTNLSAADIRQGRWTELRMTRRKRLTETELAAEVWKQEVSVTTVEATGGIPRTTLAKLNTLERFATLPHYDEETA